MSNILIYQNADDSTQVEVKLDQETVWLNQYQISELYETDRTSILKHIKNIYNSHELDQLSTCAKIAQVQKEGNRNVKRNILYYNLDLILSVGYRINSKKATQFRIWATQRLKEYLVQGYSINQKRLEELSKVVSIIQESTYDRDLQINEAKGLINLLSQYTQSYILLNQFDSNSLKSDDLNTKLTYEINYTDAIKAIQTLKNKLISIREATDIFGNEKDNSFKGILGNILQTFDGVYLYPTIEEQAANLLYLIIKNHPFTDGNKRIGAFLFIYFLERNQHRLNHQKEPKINPNGLVAIALLVAQSNPNDKDLMIQLICNLIKN